MEITTSVHDDLPPARVWAETPPLTAARARAAFERTLQATVGVEEELMLVDPETFELVPAAGEVLARMDRDPRFVEELRPSQIEIVTRVCLTAHDACRELAAGRRDLVAALGGDVRLLACGTHPASSSWGDVTEGERYRLIGDEYTWAAKRSLACGLHVHVGVAGADTALAVYNALRSYLPILAALGANSTFFEGRDTGMASIRSKLNEAFPRSGVPPAFADWEALVRFAEWGRRGGLFPDVSHLWWDIRPSLKHGTIEIRVCDTQTYVSDASAIVALIQSLAVWLAERHDRGESLPVHETHWIAENAWRAHRFGVRGWLVDLDTGRPTPTRELVSRLLDQLAPVAGEYDAVDHLHDVRALLAGNGSDRQRYVHGQRGVAGLTSWLVDETEGSSLA